MRGVPFVSEDAQFYTDQLPEEEKKNLKLKV